MVTVLFGKWIVPFTSPLMRRSSSPRTSPSIWIEAPITAAPAEADLAAGLAVAVVGRDAAGVGSDRASSREASLWSFSVMRFLLSSNMVLLSGFGTVLML